MEEVEHCLLGLCERLAEPLKQRVLKALELLPARLRQGFAIREALKLILHLSNGRALNHFLRFAK